MASIYKRKNGTYCIRVSNGMKDGKQELISATYKPPTDITPVAEAKEVKKFADLFEAAVRNGVYVPGMKTEDSQMLSFGMTLGKFIEQEYFKRMESKLSPNTIRFYRTIAEQFIIPSYGNIRLRDITAKHQQAFIDYLASPGSRSDEADAEPLSPATVKRYATVFSSIMTEACKMGYVEDNKLRSIGIVYPKIQRKSLDVYTNEEAKIFIDALKKESPMIRLLLLCALMLGMRRGEIVALQWSDINYAEMYISITKSAYKVKGQPQRVKAPKSQCGTRTVYFTASFVQALDEWRTEQSQIKSQAGDKWNEQDFIFTNAVGGMMNLYSPTSICSDFEARNGLHHLKLHGLRHTCGSLMVSNGVDPETVKNMLGHESLETTNMYIHPYTTNMKKAAELLSEVITK